MSTTSKPGPAPRGERKPVPVRIPMDQYKIYAKLAEERGIPLGSYIVLLLAETHALDIPSYISDEIQRAENFRTQEELPLAG